MHECCEHGIVHSQHTNEDFPSDKRIMKNRSRRAEITKETLEILEQGFYLNQGGCRVDFQSDLARANRLTIHYQPGDFENEGAIQPARPQDSREPVPATKTIIAVTRESTLEAAQRLVASEGQSWVLALNFASAKNPGGGFLRGSQAQEESLARATGLYPCLIQKMRFYEDHREQRCPIYSDSMIYSPDVPVLRDSNDTLLAEHYRLSILTCAAVNVGALKDNKKNKARVAHQHMLTRVEKILTVAAENGHKSLILGAWGCGVFQNDPGTIAEYFHHHLLYNPRFQNSFEEITFAILDRSPGCQTFQAFNRRFGSEAKI